jgi:hypothetical protein
MSDADLCTWSDLPLTDPSVTISVLASHDQGTHASGWWRNSDYDRCWHLSLCALHPAHGYVDLPDSDLKSWARGVFGQHVAISWTEPPASKLDIYRDAPASAYTTHVRVFLDQGGNPIQPEGEVYTLKPWDEGSPAKVFR